MRASVQTLAIVFALIILPVTAATASALPPSGFTRVDPADFREVALPSAGGTYEAPPQVVVDPPLSVISEPGFAAPSRAPRPSHDAPKPKAEFVAKAVAPPTGSSVRTTGRSLSGKASGTARQGARYARRNTRTVRVPTTTQRPDQRSALRWAGALRLPRLTLGGGGRCRSVGTGGAYQ